MTKIQMNLIEALQAVRRSLEMEKVDNAIAILNNVIKQLEEKDNVRES